MEKNTFGIVKKVLLTLFFITLITILVVLLILTRDSNFIKEVKGFIENDTKVLYVSTKGKYSDYPINVFNKYDTKYLYIDSTKLSKLDKTKLEKIIDTKNLSNTVIIFKNGKIQDKKLNYDTDNEFNSFLQRNDIIPEVIGDNKGIIESVSNLLETDFTVLYIPYRYINGIDTQNEILKNISYQYSINYKMINAYLLSKIQQEKLNSILQISSVEDQIIILIKDQKIIGSIRDIGVSNDYIEKMKEYNFIEQIDNYIQEINYEDFNNILESKDKNIILIGKDNCKHCNEVINTLNRIIMNYGINVNYINIGETDSELSKIIENKLTLLGYSDGFTTPITFMVESNKIIDYVIGASTEKYFIDIFTENGIIK